MAGFRTFATGEVLTAANVNNFLMEQATMTFADDAARDAALAGVLREGLLTYNLDTNRLEVYDGTDWVEPAPEPPAGIGSNVVSVTTTTTFATSSGSFVDVTPLEVTITPSSDTSRVLVIANFAMSNTANNGESFAALARESTLLDADSSRGSAFFYVNFAAAGNFPAYNYALHAVDSPGVDTAVTYRVRARAGNNTTTINRNGAGNRTMGATITAIEVAP